MIAKFFVVALFCVAVAQVHGESLEEQLKQALGKLKSLDIGAQKKTEQTAKDVTYKKTAITEKANIFLKKEAQMSSELIKSLETIATAVEKKATESNKPPATFECIKKVKTKAIQQIQGYGPAFEKDIRRIEKTKLAAIQNASLPLETIPATLKGMYAKYEKQIKGCKDAKSLEKVVQEMNVEYKTIFEKLGEIEKKIGMIMGDFNRDANLVFSIVSRQVNKIKGDAVEDMWKCLR